jgi:hypothetical protein
MISDAYIQSVVECVPRRMGLRDQIAMELRRHIADRLEHGQPLDEVLRQFGWFLPVLCVIGCLLGLFGYTIAAEHYVDQTVGKRLMGIHVVRESGARISLGQSAIRQLPLLGQISSSTCCSRCSPTSINAPSR